MAYRPGNKLIVNSGWFRLAAFLTYYSLILPAYILVWALYRSRIHGRKKLKTVKDAITVSNHTVLMDPVLVAASFFPDKPFQTLLEATVCAPFVGTLTRLLGGIPVPRRDPQLKYMKAACNEVFRRNKKIHFYPEGECYLYNNLPKKFHSGAFLLSASLNVPIIPMVTVFKKRRRRPTVHLYILDPVYPSDYKVKDEDGLVNQQAVKEYAEAVRKKLVDKIVQEQGTGEYYKGAMERIPGINR